MRCLCGVMVMVCVCVYALGCQPEDVPIETPARQVLPLTLTLEQRIVMPSSELRFPLPTDVRFESKSANITLIGQRNETEPFERAFVALVERDDDDQYWLVLRAEQGLFEALDVQGTASFWGELSVEMLDPLGVFATGRIEYIELDFHSAPKPVVSLVSNPGTVYPGQLINVEGTGFLRPEEGQTWAVVERGTRRAADSQDTQDLTNIRVPVRWMGGRTRAGLFASPLAVGIEEGSVEMTLRFENILKGGEVITSDSVQEFAGQIGEAVITGMTPSQGSRGELVELEGRGFVESNDVQGYGMYLRYEGNFYPSNAPGFVQGYFGPDAIQRIPFRVVNERRLEQDVWYDVNRDTRQLTGLGSTPGRFDGKVTPVLVLGGIEEIGQGLVIDFEVEPTQQVVYVRFLPSFDTGLDRFGLRNVSPGVRARVLEVMRRDYADFNVELVSEKPLRIAQYMTIEIGGADPSGMNLLGYDNSFNGVPKDTGNLFLEDYLGGYNRPGSDANFSAYGGVFVGSFVIFSPTLFPGDGSAHLRFDEVLAPVMPELGGNPVNAAEWPVQGEPSDRTRAIEGAMHMIGTLAGHTASHEIGHSLGLPFVEGETESNITYHNLDSGEPYLMDAGSARPFLERAELDGEGPAVFNQTNRAYLARILSKP